MNRLIRALSSRQAAAAATLVAFLAIGLVVYVAVAQASLTSCLAGYNDAAAKANAARSDAYEQSLAADRINTEAEDRLWEAVQAAQSLPPAEQKAAGKAAFERFLAERKRAKDMRAAAAARRASHPLPPPPSQRCD